MGVARTPAVPAPDNHVSGAAQEGETMKFVRLAVAAAFMLGFSSAYAFHSGGVAECGGCHSVHRADSSGAIIGATNTTLLAENTPSDTCLDCHANADTAPSSYHVLSTVSGSYAAGAAPVERSPGGDFGWLLKNYSFTVRGTTTNWTPGGHHINAPLYGITAATGSNPPDALAPGGTFPTGSLGCTSCHDPHSKARTDASGALVAVNAFKIIGSGSYPALQAPASGEAAISAYGTYRFLYNQNSYYTGAGYAGPVPATIAGGQVTWTGQSPLAVVPSSYNVTEASNQLRVAYANLPSRTVGLWCAGCHPRMHTNSGLIVHPIDAALSGGGENGYYNAYVNSGNKAGTAANAYLSLVPFAQNGAVRTTLASTAGTCVSGSGSAACGGPAGADTVMCLSCHRAHASGFPQAVRWETEGEFLTYSVAGGPAVWPGTDTTPASPQFARGKTSTETAASYYDRPVSVFGAFQRSLCNKCHLQD
jgi:hypothetical protein